VFGLVARSENDNGGFNILGADPFGNGRSVHAWEHKVQYNKVILAPVEQYAVESLFGVGEPVHRVSF